MQQLDYKIFVDTDYLALTQQINFWVKQYYQLVGPVQYSGMIYVATMMRS